MCLLLLTLLSCRPSSDAGDAKDDTGEAPAGECYADGCAGMCAELKDFLAESLPDITGVAWTAEDDAAWDELCGSVTAVTSCEECETTVGTYILTEYSVSWSACPLGFDDDEIAAGEMVGSDARATDAYFEHWRKSCAVTCEGMGLAYDGPAVDDAPPVVPEACDDTVPDCVDLCAAVALESGVDDEDVGFWCGEESTGWISGFTGNDDIAAAFGCWDCWDAINEAGFLPASQCEDTWEDSDAALPCYDECERYEVWY